jgi:NAD(P)-dependent dehydrogenase (short-subunit alcohol dehydrogenase family)
VAAVQGAAPGTHVRFELLDLASLRSVEGFAERMVAAGRPLDILVNNAGVMSLPKRGETADGFETQFGVNYLGHFALTLRLLPVLRAAAAARVVALSSLYARQGVIDFDDPQGRRRYRPGRQYGQSKLAMLMFAIELDRRAGPRLMSNAAHPGFARTALIANGPGTRSPVNVASTLLKAVASHSAAEGALPTLFAATAEAATGGGYYGPSGAFELKGPPKPALIPDRAKDQAVAERLWRMSEALTGTAWTEA